MVLSVSEVFSSGKRFPILNLLCSLGRRQVHSTDFLPLLFCDIFRVYKMEFSSSSKSRLTLKEFEVVNTSNYDIAGHFVDPQNKDEKRKRINIIKEEVM